MRASVRGLVAVGAASVGLGWSPAGVAWAGPGSFEQQVTHGPGAPVPVQGVTFVVNTNDDVDDGACDSVHCSLREAIQGANAASGQDTIDFSLTGSVTIRPASPLPAVQDATIIDGASQSGYAGIPLVDLDGSLAGSVANGLQVLAGPSTIRALVVNRWDGTGILIDGADQVSVTGSYIGTDKAGAASASNGMGVLIRGGTGATLGGSGDTDGNVISGNSDSGVVLEDASAATIENNTIGMSASGLAIVANGNDGIFFESDSSAEVIGNLVSGNEDDGMDLDGSLPGTLIQGNLIGPDAGKAVPGNGDNGIEGPRGSRHSAQIGGTADGDGNRIEGNDGAGIYLDAQRTSGNSIRGNDISANGALGIELAPWGATTNDAGDADSGPNGLQNFPVVTSAVRDGSVAVSGTLDSRPNRGFAIDVFGTVACDGSGYGEGDEYLGSTTVSTDPAGRATFSVSLADVRPEVEFVTTTATDGSGNTSEFSACFLIVEDQADLTVSMTDSPDPVLKGNNVTYTVTVKNDGPDPAAGVNLSDKLPAHVTYVSSTPSQGSCSRSGRTVTCSLGDMDPSASVTVSLVGTTDGHSPITNTASVGALTEDPDPEDNEASATTTVNPVPSGGVQTGEAPAPDRLPIWPFALAAIVLGVIGVAGLRRSPGR